MITAIFTDGANCQASKEKHAGSAAVLVSRPDGCLGQDHAVIFGWYVGECSNNVAELLAIKYGLLAAIANHIKDVCVVTDSRYCWGLITRENKTDDFFGEPHWKFTPTANIHLVIEMRSIITGGHFDYYATKNIKGHAGNLYNEVADQAAVWCKENRCRLTAQACAEIAAKNGLSGRSTWGGTANVAHQSQGKDMAV
jgi:ribonuclease HI